MTRLLYRSSVLYFAAILLLVLWAFWPSYFSRPFSQRDPYIHAHALSLTLWCVLVVVQASAIRARQPWLHKQLGRLSPVLVLIVLITTVAMMRHRTQGLHITDWQMTATAFNVTTLVAFVVLYSLAMFNRHDHNVHAGFMLCTAFPLFTAFVPRLIQGSRPLEHLAISIFGTFAAFGQAALVPADVTALAMSIWDWRFNRRLTIFPVALTALLTIHVSTITLYRIPITLVQISVG